MATTIFTNRPPIAKPEARSLPLTTSYVTMIEPANYDIPVRGLTTTARRIAPGVAEIGSPLIITNKTALPASVDVKVVRSDATESILILGAVVEANDSLYLALNGQYLLNTTEVLNGVGDRLQVRASANSALDATISYTVGLAEEDDVPTS